MNDDRTFYTFFSYFMGIHAFIAALVLAPQVVVYAILVLIWLFLAVVFSMAATFWTVPDPEKYDE